MFVVFLSVGFGKVDVNTLTTAHKLLWLYQLTRRLGRMGSASDAHTPTDRGHIHGSHLDLLAFQIDYVDGKQIKPKPTDAITLSMLFLRTDKTTTRRFSQRDKQVSRTRDCWFKWTMLNKNGSYDVLSTTHRNKRRSHECGEIIHSFRNAINRIEIVAPDYETAIVMSAFSRLILFSFTKDCTLGRFWTVGKSSWISSFS